MCPRNCRPTKRASSTRICQSGQFVALLAAILVLIPLPARATDDPMTVLAPLLGIPYRNDGVTDPTGRYTTFADPAARFGTPGLNCSGFVVTASRALLGRPLPLAAVKRDRKGDSGPNSPRGQDWDFGYDLLVNITEGLPRQVLLSNGASPDIDAADPAGLRGFPLHDATAWAAVLPRIRPGRLVLATLSKMVRGRLLFYHVGLLVADPAGRIWFYHATPGHGVHRLGIDRPAGMTALLQEFAEKHFGDKKILLLAVPLPAGGSGRAVP